MPAPSSTPILIKISSSTTAYPGEKIKLFNQTRSGYINATLGKKSEVIINPLDEGKIDWVDGDVIVAEMHGRLQGYGTGTFSDDGFSITITTAADTNTPAVDL